MVSILDSEQRRAFMLALSGTWLFMTGGAGVGKTYVIRNIIETLRAKGKTVEVASFTKRAAFNIEKDGKTLYELFNAFPGGLTFDDMGLYRLERSHAWGADVIVIDEISMCSKSLFEYIVYAIRIIERNLGKQIQLIVLGDYYQLPPASNNGKEVGYAFESPEWDRCNFVYVELTTQHRQSNREFNYYLNQIREGVNNASSIQYLKHIPHYLVKNENAVTLCAYRKDVDQVNDRVIAKLPGEANYYYARSNMKKKQLNRYPIRERLMLKVGALVMTTVNDPMGRFYNGSAGRVIKLGQDSVTIEIFDYESSSSHLVEVKKYWWEDTDAKGSKLYVEQLPILPAYAVTVHKAQGLTFSVVNIEPACFAEGQLYVALSRVTDVENLYILSEIKEKDIKVSQKVKDFYDRCKNLKLERTA